MNDSWLFSLQDFPKPWNAVSVEHGRVRATIYEAHLRGCLLYLNCVVFLNSSSNVMNRIQVLRHAMQYAFGRRHFIWTLKMRNRAR
jgi:hypothetical protein